MIVYWRWRQFVPLLVFPSEFMDHAVHWGLSHRSNMWRWLIFIVTRNVTHNTRPLSQCPGGSETETMLKCTQVLWSVFLVQILMKQASFSGLPCEVEEGGRWEHLSHDREGRSPQMKECLILAALIYVLEFQILQSEFLSFTMKNTCIKHAISI